MVTDGSEVGAGAGAGVKTGIGSGAGAGGGVIFPNKAYVLKWTIWVVTRSCYNLDR
jgi:hypothetical protein